MAATQVTTHVYKVAGGLSMTIDVHKPPTFNSDSGVALIHYHGGFLVIGEKTTFPPNWLINACHKRGWAYATPSYRLMPETSGIETLGDALDAATWVSENISKRLIIAGSSAGGYLAIATAASPKAPSALAVLSIYGMLDLLAERYVVPGTPLGAPIDNLAPIEEEMWAARNGTSKLDGYAFPADPTTEHRFKWIGVLHHGALYPDFLTGVKGLSVEVRNNGVGIVKEEFRPLFPAAFGLHGEFPPTALLHGDADVLVDVSQSEIVAKKLEDLGVKVLFEVAHGQGHGFDVTEVPEGFDITDERTALDGFLPKLAKIFEFLADAAH